METEAYDLFCQLSTITGRLSLIVSVYANWLIPSCTLQVTCCLRLVSPRLPFFSISLSSGYTSDHMLMVHLLSWALSPPSHPGPYQSPFSIPIPLFSPVIGCGHIHLTIQRRLVSKVYRISFGVSENVLVSSEISICIHSTRLTLNDFPMGDFACELLN